MNKGVNHRAVSLAPPNLRPQIRPAGSALFSEQAWVAIGRSLKLSGRELQIVRGVFDDQTDRCIANGIGISLHTVHTHVERLHHKLGIASRAQLLLRVVGMFLAQARSPESAVPSPGGKPRMARSPLQSLAATMPLPNRQT